MSGLIHPTALIDASASLHPTACIGAYSIIGPQVSIGPDCVIGPHVVVAGYTIMGARNRIFQFASVGEAPQDRKHAGEETWLHVGDDNVIREACSLHRGTVQDQGITRIGHRNLLMVNVHLAHDCVVGDDCTLANNAGIAGHVRIGDQVIIGGNAGVHQFCRIDSYSMVGGGSVVLKDVPAFVMTQGNPAGAHGMNYEGMRRRGWSSQTINTLRRAFAVIYRQGLTTTEAVTVLQQDLLPLAAEVQLLIDSLQQSTRGIVR